jgi:putative spermidine/putrescine transport system permease protein
MAGHAETLLIERVSYAVLWIFCILLFFFLVAPILVILPLSFSSSTFFSYPVPGWSLQWYDYFFSSPLWQKAIRNSFLVAIFTTALATPLGAIAALGLQRSRYRFKQVVMGFMIAPMMVPIIITACGLYFFLAKVGLINTLLGLVISHVVLAIPFVIIIISSALSGLDRTLVRAASGLGAKPWTVFYSITVPLILPGFVTAAVFAFITSFDEVVIVTFIAGADQSTMTRELWKGIREELSPTVLAVSTIMVTISFFVLAVIELARRKSSKMRNAFPTT